MPRGAHGGNWYVTEMCSCRNLLVQEVNNDKEYEEVLQEAARLFSNWDAKEPYITACTNAAKTSLKGATKKKKQLPYTE